MIKWNAEGGVTHQQHESQIDGIKPMRHFQSAQCKGVELQYTFGWSDVEIKAQVQEEKLIVHERVVTHFTKEYLTGLKHQSVAESRNAEIKNQLHEVKQNANRIKKLK
jgi:hypothetical protein